MNYLLILLIVSNIYFLGNAFYLNKRKTPSCDNNWNKHETRCFCCVGNPDSNFDSKSDSKSDSNSEALSVLLFLGVLVLLTGSGYFHLEGS